jgi:uncharacterized protein
MVRPIRFLCDEQLGKLSRWLRVIGLDSEYKKKIEDDELVLRGTKEERVILTRDTRLKEKFQGPKIILLEENYPALQLKEVVSLFSDRISIKVFSRCVACNGEIKKVEKSALEGKVPPFVFRTQKSFTMCESCGKYYWKATHKERVESQLLDILGELYKPEIEKEY